VFEDRPLKVLQPSARFEAELLGKKRSSGLIRVQGLGLTT
jgi:hypothetical protein